MANLYSSREKIVERRREIKKEHRRAKKEENVKKNIDS